MLRLLWNSKTLIGGASGSSTQILSSLLHSHYISSSSSSFVSANCRSSSSHRVSTKQQSYFTVKNLINPRGFFSHQFCTYEKPNSILKLLEESGFSPTQIRTLVSKIPKILMCDASKTLKPKIDFLRSVGISQADVVNMITIDPVILFRSLKNKLAPSFRLLITLVGGEQNAVDAIKRSPTILRCDVAECLVPNVETLRKVGLPNSRILRMISLLRSNRTVGGTEPHRFNNIVSTVIEMGFDPSSSMFEYAVHAMAWHSELTWEGKLKFYRSLGFSDDEILSMFRRQPISMCLSKKKVRGAVEFYTSKFRWSPLQLSERPNLLLYSLQKRVIPRSSVLQVLASRNKIHKGGVFLSFLKKTESDFVRRYVIHYEDEIPEVWDAYQGKLKFDEYNFISE